MPMSNINHVLKTYTNWLRTYLTMFSNFMTRKSNWPVFIRKFFLIEFMFYVNFNYQDKNFVTYIVKM